MTKRMLIDATQAEETRVAIVSGNRLEEYDYESAIRKQLKGSIFLAKVTRVEPSLQAAFVDYGGNRHGFLPFSEIHPDYYRIPIADREELLAEVAEQISEEVEEDLVDEEEDEVAEDENGEDEELDASDEDEDEDEDETAEDENGEDESEEEDEDNRGRRRGRRGGRRRGRRRKPVDEVGGDDEDEAPRPPRLKHEYKIQEVIKRRQIMLIQVNKEERGNKGAAVTTYISLPGRYCVLMPNSPRGGGVSRKISNSKDRARMKEILAELNIPDGMSVIMRTAGVQRSKAEIKRDLDYLMRLWDTIREETMQATAPALINEESNLCKRAIRDLYTRDIDEVMVAGDDGYKTAKSFMKMLMPSHAKRVQPYKDDNIPLFMRYQVESQIDEIHKPTAQLKSGGYIVINPTEALVSIDVNSGRSTKERHIEGTALKTNLEAAEEVARQLRLRDLGGLVVIDFIDMEVNKNNTAVERKLKEAMSTDRARVQIGRISPFGLLELSRQRLNPSLVEAHFETCPHCDGIGVVRTVESAALAVLRAIEEEGIRGRSSEVKVEVSTEVALYLLNQKRKVIQDIEQRHGLEVFIHASDSISSSDFEMDIVKGTGESESKSSSSSSSTSTSDDKPESDNGDEDKSGRRRRRRGGRKRNRNRGEHEDGAAEDENGESTESAEDADDNNDEEGNGDERKKRRRRRGRRGGRRRRGAQAENNEEVSEEAGSDAEAKPAEEAATEETEEKPKKSRSRAKKASEDKADADTDEKAEEKSEEKPKKTRSRAKKADADKDEEKAEEKPKKTRSRAKKADADKDAEKAEEKPKKTTRSRAKKADADKDAEKAAEKAEEKPKKTTRSRAKKADADKDEKTETAVVDFPEKGEKDAANSAEDNKEPEKKRKGWWNRLVD